MKKVIAIMLAVVLVVGGLGSFAYANPDPGNIVEAHFHAAWVYDVPGDTFTNGEVTGRGDWHADMENALDDTGAPVAALALTLDSGLVAFDSVEEENLVMMGPPTYQWSFGDVPEGSDVGAEVGDPEGFPVTFTPGFDASRSVDETVFLKSDGTQTQTQTITLTPRQMMERLSINVDIWENDVVNAVITSPTEGEGINLDPDGHYLDIDPTGLELDITYTYCVTIKVTPKVPEVEFMPSVRIQWEETLASGTTSGSSVSYPADEVGTWMWSAEPWNTEGSYIWHWEEVLKRAVDWGGYSRDLGNRVHADFNTSHSYRTTADSVDNITTSQAAHIHSHLHNKSDDTGQDVVSPSLELSTTQPVTNVKRSEYLVIPPEGIDYRWEFPPIGEDEGQDTAAQTDQMVEFTTGFSVSRSVDQASFPSTGGTQTLTLSVTPEEAMDKLEIHGNTKVSELDIATISSALGPNIDFEPGGYNFHIGIGNPVIGRLYQWTITIDIGPLPPGYPEVDLKYMPSISVRNVDFIASGSSFGSSLSGESRNLAGDAVLGTWTWQATGDYCWEWNENVSKEVQLEGYAEIQRNQVGAGFETSYTYRTAGDEVPNITTEQPAFIYSGLHNSGDESGLDVVGPSPKGGPILELSTTETVTWVRPDYLVSTDPYSWELLPIEQDQGFDGYANIARTAEFTTGFSVSRTVDQRRFTGPGTQVLTLSVTPEETMERLELHGHTRVAEGLEVATFTSISGEGDIHFKPGGYDFGIGIKEPQLRTYQWKITINIGSLPPEYLALEYMPSIFVRNVHVIARGDFYGSSLSGDSYSLDNGTTLGTWTWKATGDYVWNWDEKVSKDVQLEGYAINAFVVPPNQDAINDAIDAGLLWLRSQQDLDSLSKGYGAWYWRWPEEPEEKPSVGMTGLSVWSLMHGLVPQTDPQIQAGIDFILSQQNTNQSDTKNYGAIYSHQPTYETALAILALRATNNPIYLDEMTLAADYLARSQNDEGVVYKNVSEGCGPDNPAYGGWSYGYGQDDNRIYIGADEWIEVPWYVRADLSCTQFAMIGLKAAEEAGVVLSHDTWSEVWNKAETYVTRCQNPDGGFTYQPQGMPGGGGGSYGSMTAGGVWCLALTGVPVEDTRVQDGLAWLDCNYFYDRNPPGGRHNHYYFLWSAAKAFTHYGRPPVLEEGTWYYDYAGYLLANQDASGQWINPQWEVDMDDRESSLNRTGYALLILEKAVLPPPPGIDFVEVDLMKILFDRSPNRDKMEIKAHFQLAEGASYNLDEDTVIVTIGGVVITIPPGSFVGSAGKYEFKSDGEPKVGMTLNFNNGEWSLKVGHIDASAIDSSDGIPVVDVNVTLMIGYMLAGENVPTWCNDLVYP